MSLRYGFFKWIEIKGHDPDEPDALTEQTICGFLAFREGMDAIIATDEENKIIAIGFHPQVVQKMTEEEIENARRHLKDCLNIVIIAFDGVPRELMEKLWTYLRLPVPRPLWKGSPFHYVEDEQ